MFNLEAGSGYPIVGTTDVALGSGAKFAVLDGRTFLVAPYDNNARSKIFQIDENGVATEHRDVAGCASTFVRVR